jgi:hypothetical protein
LTACGPDTDLGAAPDRQGMERLRDLSHAGGRLGPGGLGGAGQLPEAAFGGREGAFEPLVGAFEGDEDGDALGHRKRIFV